MCTLKHGTDCLALNFGFRDKTPRHAEHTCLGLKHIDAWLNPANYHINGQEYIELLTGVRKTLADMGRYHPG